MKNKHTYLDEVVSFSILKVWISNRMYKYIINLLIQMFSMQNFVLFEFIIVVKIQTCVDSEEKVL